MTDETMPHLTPEVTDRGFSHLPPLSGAYGGDVRVYESSAASSPHIWLAADESGDNGARIHLPAERAWQLKEQIEWLLEHHYQGDARPEWISGDDAYEAMQAEAYDHWRSQQ